MSEEVLSSDPVIAWLEKASPDDWHRVALDHNWDEGVETLSWIVHRPDCDIATALDIFWKGQPAWYPLLAVKEGRDEADDPTWTMLKFIGARINASGYQRSRIAFDATPGLRQDYEELAGYLDQMPNPPFRAHPDMLRSRRGREVVNDADFYRRYPFAHSAMIDTPPLDEATIAAVPDLVAARGNAHTVVLNLFGLGFLAMVLVLYPSLLRSITFVAIGLAALGSCAYFAFTEFRELKGLLRENRLQLVPGFLVGTIASAVIAGALAVKPVAILRDSFAQAYGMAAFIAVMLAAAALVYLVLAEGLARLLISPRAIRDV